MGGNLRLTLPAGKCTARYTPGRMDYSQGGVGVEAQVMRSEDMALWRISNTSDRKVSVPVRFGGVADKGFSRNGDLGVDDPTCFDLKPEYCTGNIFSVKKDVVTVEYGKKERKKLTLIIPAATHRITDLPTYEGEITLKPGESKYIALFPGAGAPDPKSLKRLMARAEKERQEIVSTVTFSTPDDWLNPLGGALAIAADGMERPGMAPRFNRMAHTPSRLARSIRRRRHRPPRPRPHPFRHLCSQSDNRHSADLRPSTSGHQTQSRPR